MEGDTRQRILDAARDRFLGGGLEGVSMRAVAADVGVSATAIYRHFDGKEALLVAVAEEGFRRFAAYLWRALDAPAPMGRLRAAGLQYARFALDHDRYYRVMFMTPCEELGFGKITEKTAGSVAPTTFQFLVDRVRECIDAGALAREPADSLSATIWSQVHGHVALYLLGHLREAAPGDDAFLAFFDRSLTRLVDGLRRRA